MTRQGARRLKLQSAVARERADDGVCRRSSPIRCTNGEEIIVDLFAGGGGASDGIESALVRPVTIAINHSRKAIECHQRNHPRTHHEIADVWDVDPVDACAGRPVALLWASPSCTHYSRAKGGHNPKSAKIRALPWVVIRWARAVKPRVIFIENVPEFLDWGPLDSDGKPIKSKKGRTFKIWLGKLKAQGYVVEWRTLVSADYGAPTTRKRVYLIARRDGLPITWPEPTHAKNPSPVHSPWRTAAECIDWSISTRSIFDRKKPLAEKTLRRIAAGIVRYVLRSAQPFVVSLTHHGGDRVHGMEAPLPTVTAAHRGEFSLVAPTIVKYYGTSTASSITDPMPTVTAGAGGGHMGLVTQTLVAAALVSHYGQSIGRSVTDPVPTVTAGGHGHTALAAATLVQTGYGEREGQTPRALDIQQPLGTVVAGGAKHALCAAMLTKHFGGVVGHELEHPVGTITAKDHHAVTTATLEGAHDRRDQVREFLLSYYGHDAVTTRGRFVVVNVGGVEHQLTDIGTRMLAPNELFKAQGFRVTYDITGLTKTQQIQLCGNSVSPPVAEALVRANMIEAARKVAKHGAPRKTQRS